MARALRILILEDNPNDAELMQFELKNAGFSLTSKLVSTKDAFLKGIEKFSPDVILSDYDLPQYDGALALEEAKKRCPDIPFILVTGAVSEDRAIEILTGGAWDYVLKNRLNRLAPAVQRAIGEAEEHRARKKAEAELREAHRSLESEVEKRTAELKKETQEHKITMEELRESEERFRSAFDYSVVPMAMTSVDGRIMRVNPAFSTMLGYSESELAGMHYRKITHPDDIAENEAGLAPVMIGEKRSFRMKKRYVRKGGGIV
jgi:PAS domain S-box-containing protein